MIRTAVLDDGLEYVIIEEHVINDIPYTLFANIDDPTDICFRKTVIEDGKEYYIGLDDQKEFDLVVLHFTKKVLS